MKRVILALFLAFSPCALMAQTEGLANAKIVQGGRDEGGRPLAALVLTLQPGWKTYWRSPGDGGGIPPELDWAGSQNLDSVQVMWPVPEVWGDTGMTSIGYHNALILPLALSPINAAQPIDIKATISFGICKDICIPAFVTLTADVSGNAPVNADIAFAMANLPQPAAALGAADIVCTADPIKDGLRVTASLTLPPLAQGDAETVVMEHADRKIWASAAQVLRRGDHITAVADLVPPSAKPFDLNGDDLRLTILAGGKGAEVVGCPLK